MLILGPGCGTNNAGMGLPPSARDPFSPFFYQNFKVLSDKVVNISSIEGGPAVNGVGVATVNSRSANGMTVERVFKLKVNQNMRFEDPTAAEVT